MHILIDILKNRNVFECVNTSSKSNLYRTWGLVLFDFTILMLINVVYLPRVVHYHVMTLV